MTEELHGARVESLGIELPERVVSSEELECSCEAAGRIGIERLSGVRERRVCGEGEDSLTLATRAARACLESSRYAARDLDLVIYAGITKYRGGLEYQLEPPLSAEVARELGADRARFFDLNNACAGMMTAMWVLEDAIRRGEVRRGMVVAGEWISHLAFNATHTVTDMTHPEMASLTLGDAGAAVVLERCEPGRGILSTEFITLAAHHALCRGKLYAAGPGAAMEADPIAIHRVAITATAPVLQRALDLAGLKHDDIDHFVPHQTSTRSMRAGDRYLAELFGGTPGRVIENVQSFGNTASTTQILALQQQLAAGRIGRGQKVLLAAFASGIVIGISVLAIDEIAVGDPRPRSA